MICQNLAGFVRRFSLIREKRLLQSVVKLHAPLNEDSEQAEPSTISKLLLTNAERSSLL